MKRLKIFIASIIVAVASSVSLAQESDARKIYIITDIAVHDRETYLKYQAQVAPILKKHGGRYLIRSGAADMNKSTEDNIIFSGGDWTPDPFIILEFSSQDQARAFFESEEYMAIAPMRTGSSTGKSLMIREYKDVN